MKPNIHPAWHNDTKVTCSCGNTFTTGSIHPTLAVDICSQCHPFFTGEMKFVDVQGRVEKFHAKQKKAHAYLASVKSKRAKKTQSKQEAKRTLKEVLIEMKQQTNPDSQEANTSKA